MKAYEYRHVVPFEETNLVGNVYFSNHLRWQGHCREQFIREHAPDLVAELSRDLRLVTLRCSCEYLAEFFAFDEVIVRMRLGDLARNRMRLDFEYWKNEAGPRGVLAARGQQEVASMLQEGGRLVATPLPASLMAALGPYAAAGVAPVRVAS